MTTGSATRDHGDPGDAPTVPPPLTAPANTARPSAAEEARTIAASTNSGTLATLTADGDPWASFVTYGLLGGAPVLLGFGISTPQHVANAIAAGARGAITGSAITKIIESHCVGNHPEPAHIDNMDELKRELYDFVSVMKSATILGE